MTRIVALRDLATQVRGVTYKAAEASATRKNDTVGVVRAGNIADGELTTGDLVYVPASRVAEKQWLKQGDVLVATSSGSLDVVGKAARIRRDEEVAFGAFCKVLRPSPDVDSGYFAHFFQTKTYRRHVTRVAAGSNINNLKGDDLDNIQLRLPSIEEQRRIAAVLDAAEELRAKRRQALEKLDSLAQAIFIDMFGDPVSNPYRWPVVRLGEVVASATYGTSKKAGANGRFPVLRMGNLTVDGHLDLADMKYVDLDEREVERHTVRNGDVLFNRTNSADLVGKTAVYRLDECMGYAGYLIRLRPKPNLDSEYLGTFMNLPTSKLLLRSMCKSIVGMANINAREVQTVRLPLPPMQRQAAFSAARADVIEKRTCLEQQLGLLDTLFASLQQRAFRGEL